MFPKVKLDEYLAEMRKEVCSHCVERPPGGPPCEPLGKFCGVELHLPELVNSIHEVYSSRLIEPYLEHNRKEICEKCVFLNTSYCPCPMDYLLVLISQAVERVDRRLQKTTAQTGLAEDWSLPPGSLDKVRRVFEEAAGTWVGCDWSTKFGPLNLDLNNCKAREAQVKAEQSTDEGLKAAWKKAAEWLAEIEQRARDAETHAASALSAAEAGDWRKALAHAERAWALEFATGRPIWHGYPFTWQRLRNVIESALSEG